MNRALFLSPVVLSCVLSGLAGCDGSSSGKWSEYDACVQATTAGQSRPAVAAPQGPFSAGLNATDRAQLTNALRDNLRSSMVAQLDAARAYRIASIRCAHLRPDTEEEQASRKGSASPSSSDGAGGGGAKEVSGTNNQVAGVDEADFVKNDAKYIYVVSGSRFRIIEAWPAPEAHEIASVNVPGTAKKLFVEGNRALVYSSLPKAPVDATSAGSDWSGSRSSFSVGGGECTYGASGCVPSGDGTETEVTIFDITNRAAPQVIRSVHSTSSLVAARRIGTAVHTVLGEPSLASRLSWKTYPQNLPPRPTEADVNAAYDGLIAENAAVIAQVDTTSILPGWTDSAGRLPEGTIYQSAMPDGTSLTSLLSIDLVDPGSASLTSIISRPGWVYASADALYMAVPHERISGWGWYENRAEPELSTIHRFSIDRAPAATSYVGSGVVKGRVINQLAMDESAGHLRVATTTGHLPDPTTHNTISVLATIDRRLEVVGQIDSIAKGEDIRSARFDGDRGYIVTFKKTDPLFVFDLADPRAPRTLGELKIPGFSTYMHMMDATHLLTIGYDAADQGNFAYFTGILLQIFDVSNPADPRLAHKEVIGTRGSSSEALTNHLAFNYFAPKNLLALPMTICEGGNGSGGYGTEMTFSGLIVYDTTAASGFSLRGKVAHPNASTDAQSPNARGYYDAGCSNWWTNATSEVKRSIIMDDWVFSVSDTRIKVNNLSVLATDVKELSLQ